MADLSVILLTYNEEVHIERAIRSVSSIAKRVFVVDSFSTDLTVEIVSSLGATILQNKFVNHAKQFQWALDNLPIESEWTMRLDADEVLTPELSSEIEERLPTLPFDVSGVFIKLGYIFMGRKILHGGRCLKLMRITRTRLARVEQRWMDEHLVLSGGHAVSFKQAMFDHNLKDLTFFTEKHIKYATREAIDVLNKRYSLFPSDGSLSASSASVHAATKRFIKERVYNHLPFWLGPLGYFLYRYFLRLGFLDGRAGLIYHFLQGFWYRFLAGAKIVEYDTVLATCADNTTRLAELERLTGYRISEIATQ